MSKCWLGEKVQYDELSGKEKESYNAAKLRALMATWGYLEAFTVNGDKHGADLLFYRASDGDILKVQLKGRATLNKAYQGKDIYIAFQHKKTGDWYVYNHDLIMASTLDLGQLIGTESWDTKGSWSWPTLPSWLHSLLSSWRVPDPDKRHRFIPPEHRSLYDLEVNTWEMT